MTNCYLNDGTHYKLEARLRALATEKYCYVIGVFDCCRERIIKDKNRGVSEEEEFNNAKENLILSFGCRPTAGVPKKSTLAASYFAYLQDMARSNEVQDGRMFFILPSELNYF